jgi:hypothetical protein
MDDPRQYGYDMAKITSAIQKDFQEAEDAEAFESGVRS